MSKKTDASREIRLWVGTIISVVSTAALVASNPEVRCFIKRKIDDVKYFIRKRET